MVKFGDDDDGRALLPPAEAPASSQQISSKGGHRESRQRRRDRVHKARERKRLEHEKVWRAGEIMGLWAAALVGCLAIYFAGQDATEQRGIMKEQINALEKQIVANQADAKAQRAIMTGQIATMERQRADLDAQARAQIVLGFPFSLPVGDNDAPIMMVPAGAPAPPPLSGYLFTPSVINAGPSMALDLKLSWRLAVAKRSSLISDPSPDCPEYGDVDDQPLAGSAAPNQTVTMTGISTTLQTLQDSVGTDAEANVYLLGVIEYRDVFDRRAIHKIDWCKKVIASAINTAVPQATMFAYKDVRYIQTDVDAK